MYSEQNCRMRLKMYRTPILWLAYLLYILFGALVFRQFNDSSVLINTTKDEWTSLQDYVDNESNRPRNYNDYFKQLEWVLEECPQLNNLSSNQLEDWLKVKSIVEEYCYEATTITIEQPVYNSQFIDYLFFCVISTTTIGYGDITPVTPKEKVFCIAYTCFGIPLIGLLLAGTSTFFGERLFKIFKAQLSFERQKKESFIILWTVLYVGIGFIAFIFLPAIVFCYLEEWSYLSSVYYCFITLTTIGFGDYIPGFEMDGTGRIVYRFIVIIWILVGLGYWIMVVNFLTRAMKSKRLHNSLHKRAEVIKNMIASHQNPQFLTQRSKVTVNFMLQLSSLLMSLDEEELSSVSQEYLNIGVPGIENLFHGRKRPHSNALNLFSPEFLRVLTNIDPKETVKTDEALVDIDSDYNSVSNPGSPGGGEEALMMMSDSGANIRLKDMT